MGLVEENKNCWAGQGSWAGLGDRNRSKLAQELASGFPRDIRGRCEFGGYLNQSVS